MRKGREGETIHRCAGSIAFIVTQSFQLWFASIERCLFFKKFVPVLGKRIGYDNFVEFLIFDNSKIWIKTVLNPSPFVSN